MKRCILHIGQSKTGTSAIQGFLHLNKNKLHEKGILYPGVKFQGVKINLFNHNSIADSLSSLKRYPKLEAEEYFKQFSEQIMHNDYHTMILSGEHFFGGEPRVWDVQSKEDYIAAYIEKLQTLQIYLQEYALTIIIYLRSQAEWLESAISQIIRYEGLIGRKIYEDDSQLFELMKPVLDYELLLKQWNSILKPKEIICVPYQRDRLHGKSSVSDFIWRLGINDENLSKKAIVFKEHDSLSREYIELKKILNKEPGSKSEEWVRIYCLNRANNKNSCGEKYRISTKLYKHVQEYYLTMNSSITEKYIKEGQFTINITENRTNEASDSDSRNIAKATEYYYKEYSSFSVGIKRLEINIKIYLRTHIKPLHAFLYKVKTTIKTNLYRLS